eukprot:6771412-Pyramimonas_sp.AAC.1
MYPIRIPKYPAEKAYALKHVAARNQSAKTAPNQCLKVIKELVAAYLGVYPGDGRNTNNELFDWVEDTETNTYIGYIFIFRLICGA